MKKRLKNVRNVFIKQNKSRRAYFRGTIGRKCLKQKDKRFAMA